MSKAKRKSPVALARSVASPLVVNHDIFGEINDTTQGSPKQAEFTEETELQERFSPKHENSLRLAEAYSRLGYTRRSERVSQCGSFLEFAHPLNSFGEPEAKGKLHDANFCRDRLCPMCSWRRSLKIFGQISKIMECVVTDYKFLFLTLTVVNVPGDELPKTLDRMLDAWSKYTKRAPVKAVLRGYFRTLEVTYNEERDTFHPHFHVILAVPKSYGNGECYIKQREWLQMWRDAYGDQNITQVDIQLARPKKNLLRKYTKNGAGGDPMTGEPRPEADLLAESLASTLAEIAKYPLKDTDLVNDKVVAVYANALHGRRLVSYGGILKDMFAFLRMEDAEAKNADLIHIEDEISADVAYLICRYGWTCGVYKLVGSRIENKRQPREAAAQTG